MVAITATNSATPSLQINLSQTRLQQARRDAAQAESTAQNLRTQANNAEIEAQRSQGRVRSLASSNVATDLTYQAKSRDGVNASTPYPVQNTPEQTKGRILSLRV